METNMDDFKEFALKVAQTVARDGFPAEGKARKCSEGEYLCICKKVDLGECSFLFTVGVKGAWRSACVLRVHPKYGFCLFYDDDPRMVVPALRAFKMAGVLTERSRLYLQVSNDRRDAAELAWKDITVKGLGQRNGPWHWTLARGCEAIHRSLSDN